MPDQRQIRRKQRWILGLIRILRQAPNPVPMPLSNPLRRHKHQSVVVKPSKVRHIAVPPSELRRWDQRHQTPAPSILRASPSNSSDPPTEQHSALYRLRLNELDIQPTLAVYSGVSAKLRPPMVDILQVVLAGLTRHVLACSAVTVSNPRLYIRSAHRGRRSADLCAEPRHTTNAAASADSCRDVRYISRAAGSS